MGEPVQREEAALDRLVGRAPERVGDEGNAARVAFELGAIQRKLIGDRVHGAVCLILSGAIRIRVPALPVSAACHALLSQAGTHK